MLDLPARAAPKPPTWALAVASSTTHRPLKREAGSLVLSSEHSRSSWLLVTLGCRPGQERRQGKGGHVGRAKQPAQQPQFPHSAAPQLLWLAHLEAPAVGHRRGAGVHERPAGERQRKACTSHPSVPSPLPSHDERGGGVNLLGLGGLHAEGVSVVQGHQLGLQGERWQCREVSQHACCTVTLQGPNTDSQPASPTSAAGVEGRLAHSVPTQGKGARGSAAAVVEKSVSPFWNSRTVALPPRRSISFWK